MNLVNRDKLVDRNTTMSFAVAVGTSDKFCELATSEEF